MSTTVRCSLQETTLDRIAPDSLFEVPADPVVISLADIIAHLQADAALPLARQREMISALRTTARLLDRNPAAIPADPFQLRQSFQHLSPAACGVSRSRWNNLRSLVLTALRHAGVHVLPGRAPTPLNTLWDALRARLPKADRASRYGLSRFMSFCSAQNIAPDAVDAGAFAAFQRALDQNSLVRAPGAVYRRSCALWNKAVRSVPGWPSFRAAMPGDNRRYALEWADFPESFLTDATAFLFRAANQDPFSDDYAPSVRPSTTQLRRKQILQIATALARSGVPPSSISNLATLVETANAKRALRFFLNRAGGKQTKYLHQHALLLKTIARHWVKVKRDSEQMEELERTCRNLAIKRTGMVEKNRMLLRQFDNPENVRALINLPQKIFSNLARHDDGKRQVALQAMLALAVEVLITAPLRAHNLTMLRLDRHLIRTRRGAVSTCHIVIKADEPRMTPIMSCSYPQKLSGFWRFISTGTILA